MVLSMIGLDERDVEDSTERLAIPVLWRRMFIVCIRELSSASYLMGRCSPFVVHDVVGDGASNTEISAEIAERNIWNGEIEEYEQWQNTSVAMYRKVPISVRMPRYAI